MDRVGEAKNRNINHGVELWGTEKHMLWSWLSISKALRILFVRIYASENEQPKLHVN